MIGHKEDGVLAAFSYGIDELRTLRVKRNGGGLEAHVDTRTYDSRYRLGTWTLGSGLLNYTHQFDDDSNLTGRTDNLVTDNSYDRTYGYDALHRLTTATGPWVEASTCPGGGYVRLRLERQPDLQG